MENSNTKTIVKLKREDGHCAICQQYVNRLSVDHIWPRGGHGIGSFDIYQYPITQDPKERKRVKASSGITTSAICEKCNNKLGALYDKPYCVFVKDITMIATSRLVLPKYPSIQTYPTAIIKSVLGHMLATKVSDYPSEISDLIRSYLFNEEAILPERLHLYYWYYPYDKRVAVIERTAYDRGSTCVYSILKAYPLAFLLMDKATMTDKRFVELTNYNPNDISVKRNIPFRMFSVEQDFPESSRYSPYTFVINDSTRLIAIQKD